jgi:hypothetical protein
VSGGAGNPELVKLILSHEAGLPLLNIATSPYTSHASLATITSSKIPSKSAGTRENAVLLLPDRHCLPERQRGRSPGAPREPKILHMTDADGNSARHIASLNGHTQVLFFIRSHSSGRLLHTQVIPEGCFTPRSLIDPTHLNGGSPQQCSMQAVSIPVLSLIGRRMITRYVIYSHV